MHAWSCGSDEQVAAHMLPHQSNSGLPELDAQYCRSRINPTSVSPCERQEGLGIRSPHEPDRVLHARWRHAGPAVPDIAPQERRTLIRATILLERGPERILR